MPREKKHKQIRTCGQCGKVGHNKATCTEVPAVPLPSSASTAPTQASTKSTAAPLKFFVHHVDTSLTPSPHVVNLKTVERNVWQHVAAEAPTTKDAPHAPPPSPSIPGVQSLLTPSEPTIETLIKRRNQDLAAPNSVTNTFFSSLPEAPAPAVVPDHPVSYLYESPEEHPSKLRALGAFIHRALHPKVTIATGLSAAVILLGLVVPSWAWGYYENLQSVKQTLLDTSTAGFMALQESTAALRDANFVAASDATDRALEKFSTALGTLNEHKVLRTLASLVPVVHGEVASREHILLAGDELALGNKQLLAGVAAIETSSSSTLAEKITVLNAALTSALPNYTDARKHLSSVDPSSLPTAYQTSFNDFRSIFNAAVDDFITLHQIADRFHDIFGNDGFRRYLIVFQNENELRPTGGFMGSYAVMDVRGGKITNLTVPAGGSYDVQGQLSVYEKPPVPLTLNNKRWEFQDANWFPHFPTSAEQAMWFYRKSRGTSVDGVIAINSNFLTRLLTIFGPVTSAEHGVTLSDTSAINTIQSLVESPSARATHAPKQIISDLAPIFLNSFSTISAHNVLPLLATVEEALQEKEVQLYFIDPTTQAVMDQFGWSGAIKPTAAEQDYLAVYNANIGGQKSDARIKQTINHESVVQADGSIIDTVTITRVHGGDPTEPLYGAVNTDYVRVYVPLGSELISAQGFSWPAEKNFQVPEDRYTTNERLAQTEQHIDTDTGSGTRITNEFGKTAFGNWIIVEPGSTARVELRYRLPFTIETLKNNNASDSLWNTFITAISKPLADYQLVVQKQSGITSDFSSTIIFPDNWHPVWKTDDGMSLAKNGAIVKVQALTTDKLYGVLMQPDSH